MNCKKNILAAVIGSAAMFASGFASADESWTFNHANCDSSVPGSTCAGSQFAQSQTYNADTAGAPQVTVTAWANTFGTENEVLEQGEIVRYGGGLGARNADWTGSDSDSGESGVPEHAVDNNGRFDVVMASFGGTEVSLNEISLGYSNHYDADISVLAWGGAVPPPTLAGVKYNASAEDLTGGGWEFIGNYDVDALDDNGNVPLIASINSGNVSSSYWLIGAYNSVFSSEGCEPAGKCYKGNDYFKIQHLAGHIPDGGGGGPSGGVPAPGTLLLMGLAGFPLFARRRRQRLVV